MYKLYFDGSCLKNPGGISSSGCVLYKDKDKIWSTHITLEEKNTSSNVAEYAGLIIGLLYLLNEELGNEEITVIGDSKLVISQMFRGWKVKKGAYVKYAHYAHELVDKFSNIKGKLIPRDLNEEADHMSKIYSTELTNVLPREERQTTFINTII